MASMNWIFSSRRGNRAVSRFVSAEQVFSGRQFSVFRFPSFRSLHFSFVVCMNAAH